MGLHLGNGRGHSVREVIETVKRVSGKDFKIVSAARRAGDAAILVSDAGMAGSELNWKPRFPDLEEIISTAWRWHSAHPTGYPD